MKIILSGSIGRLPVGGHAWAHLQYLAGLAALGHEVIYLEDCGEESWVYNWDTEALTTDLSYPASFVAECLDEINLRGRFLYRAGDNSVGMPLEEFHDFCNDADLLILFAVPLARWRPEYDYPKRRVYIDVDPGFIQIDIVNGHRELNETIGKCERLFTIGQRFGEPGCLVPRTGHTWFKTVNPVALDHWPVASSEVADFTTVMQWRGFRDVVFEGTSYGQKDMEFSKFADLPQITRQPICLALTGTAPEPFRQKGWKVVEGWLASKTPSSYRAFIQGSRGELSIAKHGYVLMRAGWFSDRSACYLASGRPVVVQDTGIGEWLPTGSGVLTFRNVEEAAVALDRVNADYDANCRRARQIAEEYFSTNRILPIFLCNAMN